MKLVLTKLQSVRVMIAVFALANSTAVFAERPLIDSQLLASEAVGLLHAGQYAEAIDKLKCSIECNAADDDGKCALRMCSVSSSDRDWGRKQLKLMLRDRPNMQLDGIACDQLNKLAVDLYAGGLLSQRIAWDGEDPARALSEFWPPEGDTLARIRIRSTYPTVLGQFTQRTFEELWSSFFLEMHNICNSRAFVSLNAAAQQGSISKMEFIKRKFMAEASAVQRTRGFYVREFLPIVAEKKLATDARLWYCAGWWGSRQELFEKLPKASFYPWRTYGDHYDAWALAEMDRILEGGVHNASRQELARLKNYAYACPSDASRILAEAIASDKCELVTLAQKLRRELKLKYRETSGPP